MKEGSRPLTALVLLWLAGNALRLPILAIPPVLALIQRDLHLTGTEIGVLTGLPVILFAAAAVPGSLLIARVGALAALVIGLLLAAAGSALRGISPGIVALYAATVAMGAGIAIMQPSLPPIVRAWLPERIGFGTAVYTNGLLVGESLPVAFTIPFVLPLFAESWRASLVFWSVPLVAIAILVFVFQPKSSAAAAPARRWWPDWRDPLLWKLSLAMGAANTMYFCSNGFLPGYLTSAGRSDLIGPALSVLNVGQLPASFLLLAMASRWERRAWPFMAAGAIALAGVAGIVTTANWWTAFSAGLIGFACASVLALALALPALLVPHDDVPRLAAGMFTIGYGMAMLVSVIAGACWDATGIAAFAFLPIAFAGLPLILLTPSIDFAKRSPR
ncbi:MAG TPA: MFS transporter [Xanthobacteraceae bacterium]|nr:MFS transporter [Xanthobacteraceae bacterium]